MPGTSTIGSRSPVLSSGPLGSTTKRWPAGSERARPPSLDLALSATGSIVSADLGVEAVSADHRPRPLTPSFDVVALSQVDAKRAQAAAGGSDFDAEATATQHRGDVVFDRGRHEHGKDAPRGVFLRWNRLHAVNPS
jgi:hypothetical protein